MKKSILKEKPKIITEAIILEWIKKAISVHFTKDVVEGIKLGVNADFMAESYIFTAVKKLLAFKAGDRIVRYPENWKEAFKERWFPAGLKKLFPVKYTEYDVLVIFPNLLKKHPCPESLRNQNYYINFVKHPFMPSDGEEK